MHFSLPPLWLVGPVLLGLALLSWRQPRALFALAQWSHAVAGLDEDAELFYARLFRLLEDRLEARPLPFSSLSMGPCPLFATRTLWGGTVTYLQVRYQHLTYYVYACPMPGGLFVSTWLFSSMAGWEERPLLRWLLMWRLYRMTLFGSDCLEMFHLTVHGAVLDLLNDYTRERSLPPLDAAASRPVLHGFYARRKGVVAASGVPASGTLPGPLPSPAPPPSPARLPFEPPDGRAIIPSPPSAPLPFEGRSGSGRGAEGPP